MRERRYLGCVAENDPWFLQRALWLMRSVLAFGGSLVQWHKVVAVVGDCPDHWAREFEALGVQVRIVERYDTRHPHSNKFRWLELNDVAEAELALLLDCDIVCLADPLPMLAAPKWVAAKVADLPSVDDADFATAMRLLRAPLPPKSHRATVSGHALWPYYNAGVMLFSARGLRELVPLWSALNRVLIEHLELLSPQGRYHCEQIALTAALAHAGATVSELDDRFNFPIHLVGKRRAPWLASLADAEFDNALADCRPFFVHYHDYIHTDGRLRDVEAPGFEALKQAVCLYNAFRARAEDGPTSAGG